MTAPERGTPISEHPDLVALQSQSSRSLARPATVAVEGLLTLAGAYTAISPWVVNFHVSQPLLTANNLILGLIIVAMGLGITGTPERGGGITWAAAPMGVWLFIATWVMTFGGPSVGIVWNNVVVGCLAFVLGIGAASMVAVRRHSKS